MKGIFGALCLCFVASITGLQNSAQARRLIPVESDPAPANGVIVTVVDDRAPLAGARVLIETLDGKVLADAQADAQGSLVAAVSDQDLAAGVNVTAWTEGHGAVSFLQNVAHRVTLELPAAPTDSYSMLKGRLSGFNLDDDGRAVAGVVAKALEMNDLAQLDVTSFVSPLKDQIDVFGKRNIPSNVILPDQSFNVYFIPIHVNKPDYRLPVLSGTANRYFSVVGAVDATEAVGAFKKSDPWPVVNLAQIEHVGLSDKIEVSGPGKTIDADMTASIDVKEAFHLTSGRNTGAADSHRLVASLWEPEPGVFVPTDAKVVGDGELTLSAADPSHARLLDVVIGAQYDHFSGTWVAPGVTNLGDNGLTGEVQLPQGVDGSWLISGGENAQLAMAHVEDHVTNSQGAKAYVDRWVVVGPRQASLALPAAARAALKSKVGKFSHLSVDLLQTGHTGYPFISGATAAGDLVAIEKIRKELK